MSEPKKKRNSRDLSRVIHKESSQFLNSSKKPKRAKSQHRISVRQTDLLHDRAEEYDNLVRSLLVEQRQDKNRILLFNYQDGFVWSDVNEFGKYSVRL